MWGRLLGVELLSLTASKVLSYWQTPPPPLSRGQTIYGAQFTQSLLIVLSQNYGTKSNLFTDKMALVSHLSCGFFSVPLHCTCEMKH